MAVKTIWHIDFLCGHSGARDLSDRAADRRAGFAEWLAKQECTDCWRSAKEGDGGHDKLPIGGHLPPH
ncbi:hypothetical protein AB0D86_44755 [Streptomyces sp. NPDC048324]|uniref:hypothetical protein n=1 Tax=Streptomyces sp. NPDC048324 TaxID=3157205 RepID=UPI0034295BC7